MQRVCFFLMILLCSGLSSGTVRADCGTPVMAGDYALSSVWTYKGQDAFLTGKLEVSSSGRVVMRGGRLTYQDGARLVTHLGSAAGRLNVWVQCTGVLNITVTERDAWEEVAKMEANLVVSGDRSSALLEGTLLVSMKQPGLGGYFARDLLGTMVVRKIGF